MSAFMGGRALRADRKIMKQSSAFREAVYAVVRKIKKAELLKEEREE